MSKYPVKLIMSEVGYLPKVGCRIQPILPIHLTSGGSTVSNVAVVVANVARVVVKVLWCCSTTMLVWAANVVMLM